MKRVARTFLARGPIASVLALLLGCGCVADGVPSDVDAEPECGNGVLESGEQCDVAGPGCAGCRLTPGWTCDGAICTTRCEDGVVGADGARGPGVSCADPRRDSDCDLTGYWAVRETAYTRDTVVGALQTSSTWQLYRLQQTGDAFEVVEQLACGIRVTGSVTVDETAGTLRALVYRNRMDGASKRGPRKGASRAVAGGCAVSFDRWYQVHGVSEDAFLPPDFSKAPALSELLPLPAVEDPTKAKVFPTEAEDWDGDGIPGVAYRLTGFANGVRNAVQRDFREFATFADRPVPARAMTFTVPGAFDLQERVLSTTQCGGLCSLVAAPANPARDVVGRVTLSFLGRTYGSARVSAVVVNVPRRALADDLSTCARVRQLLPHDTSTPTPKAP